jgi:hypothetical protein
LPANKKEYSGLQTSKTTVLVPKDFKGKPRSFKTWLPFAAISDSAYLSDKDFAGVKEMAA